MPKKNPKAPATRAARRRDRLPACERRTASGYQRHLKQSDAAGVTRG